MLKAPEGEGNIKEATLAEGRGGQYNLFYEYARNNASRIGRAVGPSLEGPWTVAEDPFGIREDSWDNWHLSTGPIVQREGEDRSEEHTSELQSLMRISYAVFCLKKKKN